MITKERMLKMKLKSLKNALRYLNLEITKFPKGSNREGLYRIHKIHEPSKIVATISQDIPLRFSTNHQLFETFTHKEILLHLILTFTTTPINERGDRDIYELKMLGLHKNRNILLRAKQTTSDRAKGEYFFGHDGVKGNNKYYQRTFTEKEIDELPRIFKKLITDGFIERVPYDK